MDNRSSSGPSCPLTTVTYLGSDGQAKAKTPDELLKMAMAFDTVFYYSVYKIECQVGHGRSMAPGFQGTLGSKNGPGTFHQFISHLSSYHPSEKQISDGRLDSLFPDVEWIGEDLWSGTVGYTGLNLELLCDKTKLLTKMNSLSGIYSNVAEFLDDSLELAKTGYDNADLKRAIDAIRSAYKCRRAAYRGMFGGDPPEDGAFKPTIALKYVERPDGVVGAVVDFKQTILNVQSGMDDQSLSAKDLLNQMCESSGSSTDLVPEEQHVLLENICAGKRTLAWVSDVGNCGCAKGS